MTRLAFLARGARGTRGFCWWRKTRERIKSSRLSLCMRGQQTCFWKKKKKFSQKKLCMCTCVHLWRFGSVCVRACTFPVGPPLSMFPLSQCWNLRRPIKARLPSCDFSVSRLSALTLLDWGMLSNSLRWQLVLWCSALVRSWSLTHIF